MSFNVLTTPHFEKALKDLAKHYKSMKADYGDFKESIKKNPFQGSDLGCGLRKIRIKITSKGKGKSGGARVITYTVLTDQSTGDIWLIDIYDKSEYSTIDVNVVKAMIKEIDL